MIRKYLWGSVFVVCASDVGAQTVAAAIARMQSGDTAAAITMLEHVVATEPTNARAMRVLGLWYIQRREVDRSITTLRRSLVVEPDVPPALYNLAAAYALRGNRDSAFAYLARAKATGKLDMTQAQVDTEFAAVRHDARFAKVMPTAADFEHPFVEPVTVIREWDGESAGDQFGWIARGIGDVDGDGAEDFVTSAPTKDIGGANAGRIYAYSSRSGKLLWSADGKPGEQLGTGIESAGDVDGDGIQDVIAGAPFADVAYVYSGKDGHVLLTLHGEHSGDMFGTHVGSVGDINHDGHAGVIVGAPNNNAGGTGAGRVYVYSGKDGHLIETLTGEGASDGFGSEVAGYTDAKHSFIIVGAPAAGPHKVGRVYVYDGLSAKPKFVIDADSTGAALGAMFVSVVGDVNGDGVPDIYASDFTNTAKGRSTGRIYVHSGADGRRLLTLTGDSAGEGFGIGPARAGDVDHDGYADLIVGAWQYAGAATSGGRAYLYSGRDGHLMRTFTDRVPGDTFGFDAVGIGDVGGDGAIDLLITAAWSGVRGYRSGRIFIVSTKQP